MMNPGQFGDMMAAFDGLMQRLDKVITLMEQRAEMERVNWNSRPAGDEGDRPTGYGGRKPPKGKVEDVEAQLEAETGHDVVQTGKQPPTFVETDKPAPKGKDK